MLEHYVARMQAEGVTLDEGSCFDGEGEGAYIPGDEEVASRQGCFITDEGVANYRLTLPGAHVYIGIVGHNIEHRAPGFRVPGQPGHPGSHPWRPEH